MTDFEGFEGPARPLKLYYLGRGEDWGFLFQEQKTGGPIRREGLIVLLGILTGDLDFLWVLGHRPKSLSAVPLRWYHLQWGLPEVDACQGWELIPLTLAAGAGFPNWGD